MSDIEKCFSFLRDTIPSWLGQLQHITDKIKEKQNKVAKVPVAPKAVKRKGSTETLKGYNGLSPDPEEAGFSTLFERQALASSTRKRKTASVLSKNSGPSKYRARGMIVVYYDADVQKAFETLVRDIGIGMNMLRKAKMAAHAEAMSSRAQDGVESALLSIQNRPRARLSNRRTAQDPSPSAVCGAPGLEAFDAANLALDTAQSLCERGAHQSLRDGGCLAELEGARKSLTDAIKIAEAEVEKQSAKAEQCEEQPSSPASIGSSAEEDIKDNAIEADGDTPVNQGPTLPAMLPSAVRLMSHG